MPIEYRRGDFINSREQVLVHGCNAQGVMGRGAALGIKTRLPFAYEGYRHIYETRGLVLGDIVWTLKRIIVGNMITQEDWRSEHAAQGRNVDYDAVRSCFRKLNEWAQNTQHGHIEIANITPVERVAMPKIGAGLGGGAWDEIAAIIEEESVCFRPVVYML